jgi:hypothetical protein
MRELEQEQFRQFCQAHAISTQNHESTINNNEDANKELLK